MTLPSVARAPPKRTLAGVSRMVVHAGPPATVGVGVGVTVGAGGGVGSGSYRQKSSLLSPLRA